MVLASSLPLIGYSVIFTFWLLIPAGILFIGGFLGWALEPADDPEAAHDHHDDDHDGDHDVDADDADAADEGASVG